MKKIQLDITYPQRIFEATKKQNEVAIAQLKQQGIENPEKYIEEPSSERASLNVIAACLDKNLSKDQLKMWSKIQDRMVDENSRPLKGEIELSDEQFDFIYEEVANIKTELEKGIATIYTYFSEYLEEVKIKQKEN